MLYYLYMYLFRHIIYIYISLLLFSIFISYVVKRFHHLANEENIKRDFAEHLSEPERQNACPPHAGLLLAGIPKEESRFGTAAAATSEVSYQTRCGHGNVSKRISSILPVITLCYPILSQRNPISPQYFLNITYPQVPPQTTQPVLVIMM